MTTSTKDSGLGWAPRIPAHWDVAKVCLVARLESGHTPSRQHPEYWIPEECTIPWFSLADVWQLREAMQDYLGDTAERISPRGLANSAARLLPAGTVVLSRTASVGFSGIMPRPMATTQDFANWVCGPRILPEFLLFAFRAMKDEFGRAMMGSTHQTIYMPDIRRLAVPIPPIGEQRAIVGELRRRLPAIDGLVKKKEQLVELLAAKRQALIAVTVTKGFQPSAPTKDSGVAWIGQLPKHWTLTRASMVTKAIEPGPFGSQLHASDYVEGGIPLINPKHISASGIQPEADSAVDEATARRLTRHRLHPGDVIFARRGELGRCAVVREREAGWVCGTGCMKALVREELISSEFLALVAQLEGSREWLSLQSVGATMENLNASILGRLPVALPPLSEQNEIVRRLERELRRIDDLTSTLQASIKTLGEYRQRIISAAVVGQLDLPWEEAA